MEPYNSRDAKWTRIGVYVSIQFQVQTEKPQINIFMRVFARYTQKCKTCKGNELCRTLYEPWNETKGKRKTPILEK